MIRVVIEDTSLDLAVTVSVGGGYSPDVLHDLQGRAIDCYRRALCDKLATLRAAGVDATDE